MRDIKFRAWDKNQRKLFKIFDSVENKEWFLPNWKERHIVMQYTGILDENGVEIYEGDIIQTKGTYPGEGWFDTGEHDYNFISSIIWDCEELTYMVRGYQLKELENLIVIGNIYENPELSEVQEDV